MKLEFGKYYMHDSGMAIAVLGEVAPLSLGKILIVETVHEGKPEVTFTESGQEMDGDKVIEISQEEFLSGMPL